MPDRFGLFFVDFLPYWTVLDHIGPIWTILSNWTSLFGPVYLDLSIWTCLTGPVYLIQSIWTCIFGTRLFGPVSLEPVYFDLSLWTRLFALD